MPTYTKVSDLAPAGTLTGNELFLVSQDIGGGVLESRKTTLNNFAGSKNLAGTTLFVNPLSANASDLYTRAEALGKPDKPFSTLQAAFNASVSGDAIMLVSNIIGNLSITTNKDLNLVIVNTTLTGNITCTFVNSKMNIYGIGNANITGNVVQGALDVIIDKVNIGGYVQGNGIGRTLTVQNCESIGGFKQVGGSSFTTYILRNIANVGYVLTTDGTSFLTTIKAYNCKITGTCYAHRNMYFEDCVFTLASGNLFNLPFNPATLNITLNDCIFDIGSSTLFNNIGWTNTINISILKSIIKTSASTLTNKTGGAFNVIITDTKYIDTIANLTAGVGVVEVNSNNLALTSSQISRLI